MGTDLDIREACSALAAVMATLHQASMDGPWDEPSWPVPAWQSLLADSTVLGKVAVRAGEPCGFLVGRTVADEADILAFGVLPKARRAGIGRRLAADWLDRAAARGATRVFLEVASLNRAARVLYDRLGFCEAGRRPKYYSAGAMVEDALILSISLESKQPTLLTDRLQR